MKFVLYKLKGTCYLGRATLSGGWPQKLGQIELK
jgi:hypothetical protein